MQRSGHTTATIQVSTNSQLSVITAICLTRACVLSPQGEDGAAAVWSVVEPHSAPQVSNEARPVLSVVLPGTPRDFFDTLLADASHLLEDFYEAQGNRCACVCNTSGPRPLTPLPLGMAASLAASLAQLGRLCTWQTSGRFMLSSDSLRGQLSVGWSSWTPADNL